MSQMRIAVLGSMSVHGVAGVAPSGEIARRVLAVLAASANRSVAAVRLADLVWPDAPQASGNSLQAHVSRWRKVLGAQRIEFTSAGYRLRVDVAEIDALQFEEWARVAQEARRVGDLDQGIATARKALGLWRGQAFAEFEDDCLRSRRAELETSRAMLQFGLVDMLHADGAHDEALPEAIALTESEPWNESAHRLLARIHYARGGQVDALEVLTELEKRLRDELGLDPAPATRGLREQILRQAPALDSPYGSSGRPLVTSRADVGDRIAALPVVTQQVLQAAALAGAVSATTGQERATLDTAQLARAQGIDGSALADALAPALTSGLLVRTDNALTYADESVRAALQQSIAPGVALVLHRRLGEGLSARLADRHAARRAAEHLAVAASLDAETARQSVDLDSQLAHTAMAEAEHVMAAAHARRALSNAAYLSHEDAERLDRVRLWLLVAEALQRNADLSGAMVAYLEATRAPDVPVEVVCRAALAYEECSLHARRPRHGAQDPALLLLTRAIEATELDLAEPDLGEVATRDPASGEDVGRRGESLALRARLMASLAQAWAFSGGADRAVQMSEAAVISARASGDAETIAHALLRQVSVLDPVTGAVQRRTAATEAVELAEATDGDELLLDALAVWVPELMRAGRLREVEQVISRIQHLAEVQGNALHRCKVPMWRAAIALAAGRYDEAEVLMADFWELGTHDGYADTARIHGFQMILWALGRGEPDRAADILVRYDDDVDFEPWRATALLVAHHRGDDTTRQRILLPWSARRFAMARPFAGIQVFCAALIADAVAAGGDAVARERLADLLRPGVGQNQVLGAGAAMLGDAAGALARLVAADGDDVVAAELEAQAVRHRLEWGLGGGVG